MNRETLKALVALEARLDLLEEAVVDAGRFRVSIPGHKYVNISEETKSAVQALVLADVSRQVINAREEFRAAGALREPVFGRFTECPHAGGVRRYCAGCAVSPCPCGFDQTKNSIAAVVAGPSR